MILETRPYQEESVNGLFQFFTDNKETNRNPIVGLPTGTGKSVVIALFIYRALLRWPSTRVLMLTHVQELIQQNLEELLGIWPSAPVGVYSAGLKRKETHQPITFCGIASVVSNVQHFGRIELVIVDECHLISDKATTMYQRAIAKLREINPLVRIIGLTATPYRIGLGSLTDGSIFTDLSTDYCNLEGFNSLIDAGYLAPLIPKRTDAELDVEGVKISNGEFSQDELQAACDKPAITQAALKEACELAKDRRHWLVFCTGKAHAEHAAAMLVSLGVSCVVVHSDISDDERKAAFQAFKTGRVRALVGVNIFTTGFNFRPIDCIIVLRPTMSAILWVQMLGRGTRPSPETGKVNCLVLDFAANTRRLGPINDPVLPRKKGKKSKGAVPYKTCPTCNTYNHTRARFCCNCMFEFPENFDAKPQAATDELIRKKREPKPQLPQETAVFTIETFDVARIEFDIHFSRDHTKKPSLRVSYYCGLRVFNEYLCFEHEQRYARHKANETWRQMDGGEPTETINDALSLTHTLTLPNRIRVLMKPKFPEVLGYEFSGEPPPSDAPPF